MSVDKLVDSTQLDNNLTSVANAIRTKGGTSAPLQFPTEFVSAIQAIPQSSGIYLYESKYITTDASYDAFDNFKNAVVPDLPLDKTFVLIEFVNNTTTTRSGIYWMQCITPETGIVRSVGARVGGSFGDNYGCNVHAGATINIYVGDFN